MPKGKGYGGFQGSPEAINSLIADSNRANVARGILELGSKLRTADTMRANKKKFQGGVSQKLFNRMGAKLYGQSMRDKYNKSGFRQPTGSELVAGFNRAKAESKRLSNVAKQFQPASGQTLVKNLMSNNPINKINRQNLRKLLPNNQLLFSSKSSGGDFKSLYKAQNKKGDIEGFNARMRRIHKERGIKVTDKSKYRAYMGY